MTAETFRRHVSGTPTQAMAVILDVERWPQWQPGVLRIVHLSDRPVRAGSVWLDARSLGRREVKFTARVVEADPPHVFAYALAGGGLEASIRWTVRQDEGRVLVEQRVEAHPRGLLGLLTDSRKQFLASQRATMDRLRSTLAVLSKQSEGGA